MIPKQIIYPINYSKIWKSGDPKNRDVFLDKFRDQISAGFCLSIGRARAGIYLFVKQFVRPGRNKVILSAYTIPDVVNMVIFAGGLPVFVDTLPNSTNVDLNQLEDLLDDQTACVMITHYHVNQSEYKNIIALCSRLQIELFEDCAIALGGQIEGSPVGSGSAGGIFSLSSFKFLNFIWGGVVSTRHESLYLSLKEEVTHWPKLCWRDYWPAFRKTLLYDLSTRPKIYNSLTVHILRHRQRHLHQPVSLSLSRLESTSLNPTLTSQPHHTAFAEWNRKFEHVQRYLIHRKQIAATYAHQLDSLMVSKETNPKAFFGSCFVNYPIVVPIGRRDEIYKRLLLAGYEVGLSLYPNVHSHPKFKGLEGYSNNISSLVQSVISLPTHPLVTFDYAKAISEEILKLL